MKPTLADIQKAAEADISTSIDDATPAGHFGATTVIAGKTVCFLLQGELDSPTAIVKGRIVMSEKEGRYTVIGYLRGRMAGGIYMGQVTDFKETFAKMI